MKFFNFNTAPKLPFGKRENAEVAPKQEVIPVIPEVQALFDEAVSRAKVVVDSPSNGIDTATRTDLLEAIATFDSVKYRDDIMNPEDINYASQSFSKRTNFWMRANLMPNLATIIRTAAKTRPEEERGPYDALESELAKLYKEPDAPYALIDESPPIV